VRASVVFKGVVHRVILWKISEADPLIDLSTRSMPFDNARLLEERLQILFTGNAVHFNPVLKEQQG